MIDSSSFTPPSRPFSHIERLAKGYYEELSRVTDHGNWYESDGRKFTRVVDGFLVNVALDQNVDDEVRRENIRSLAVDLSTPDLVSAFDVFGYLVHKYYEGDLSNNVILVAQTNREQIEIRKDLGVFLGGYNLEWDGLKGMPGTDEKSRFVGSFDDVKKAVVGDRIDFSKVCLDYACTEVIKFSMNKKGIDGLTLHGKPRTSDSYMVEHVFAGTEKDVIAYAAEIDRAMRKRE